MNVHGTREAFMRMLSERGVYKKIGVSRTTANNWKRAILGDDLRNIPTINKMENLLNKFGAFVITEKVWEMPETKRPVMLTEIRNVIVSNNKPHGAKYNAEIFVSYHDGQYWRSAGIANLIEEEGKLKANIKLFKQFPYENKYPKIALHEEHLHSILLIDSAAEAEPGIKPLGYEHYVKIFS
jgi:hypothetical protein